MKRYSKTIANHPLVQSYEFNSGTTEIHFVHLKEGYVFKFLEYGTRSFATVRDFLDQPIIKKEN